ncbi:hypothetical protein ACL03H_20945 [Saccharopolyspora sp. MS10]|uniref:hypothetical protein n=1 Tax=Saccharopolyspora sp. MS10 TaxID=3385973 RepID=UPI00399F7142
MVAAILTAEAAFWALLVAGLLARYAARRPALSTWLLRGVPAVDVLLVALVVLDLAAGAEPTRAHALAAVYLGCTVAFGRATIAWADVRFRRHFRGVPAPAPPAPGSRAAVRALWLEWLRVVLAGAIAAPLLLALIAIDGFAVPATAEEVAQHPCWSTLALLGIVIAVWFLAGPAFAGTGRSERETAR